MEQTYLLRLFLWLVLMAAVGLGFALRERKAKLDARRDRSARAARHVG